MKFVNATFMIVGMYFVFKLFDFQLDTSRTISILILTFLTSAYGLVSYWIGSKVFGIEEADYFERKIILLKDRIFKKKQI